MARGYNPIMSEKNNFPINASELQGVHSHDYCIDKLLECGSVIFIIGTEYGGEYAGKKYKKLQQEIIKRVLSREIMPQDWHQMGFMTGIAGIGYCLCCMLK